MCPCSLQRILENRAGIGKDILVRTCVKVDGDESGGPNAGVDGIGESSTQESHVMHSHPSCATQTVPSPGYDKSPALLILSAPLS